MTYEELPPVEKAKMWNKYRDEHQGVTTSPCVHGNPMFSQCNQCQDAAVAAVYPNG